MATDVPVRVVTRACRPGPCPHPRLRDGILALWTDVTNAGGAVGFVPPVTVRTSGPELVKHLVAMAEGGAPGCSSGATRTGAVAATAFLTSTPTG